MKDPQRVTKDSMSPELITFTQTNHAECITLSGVKVITPPARRVAEF